MLDTKLTNEKVTTKKTWITGILLILMLAVMAGICMAAAYSVFREKAGIAFLQENVEERENNSATESSGQEESSSKLFTVDEGFLNYLTSSIYYLDFMTVPNTPATDYFFPRTDCTEEEYSVVSGYSELLLDTLREQAESNASLNSYWYHGGGVSMQASNAGDLYALAEGRNYYSEEEKAQIRESYDAGIIIYYDLSGNPQIESAWNMEYKESVILEALEGKTFRELLIINGLLSENASLSGNEAEIFSSIAVPVIKNKVFVFAIGEHHDSYYNQYSDEYWEKVDEIQESGYILGWLFVTVIMFVLAVILQNIKVLETSRLRIFHLPLELSGVIGCILLVVALDYIPTDIAVDTVTNVLPDAVFLMGVPTEYVSLVTHIIIAAFWSAYAFAVYWATASLLPYVVHPIQTVVKYSLIISLIRLIFRGIKKSWGKACEIKLGKKSEWMILILVLVNWTFGTLCCHFVGLWTGGMGFFSVIFIPGVLLVYNLVIYIYARYMVHKVMTDYSRLHDKTQRLAGGDFEKYEGEQLGMYAAIGTHLDAIGEGFQKAVAEEVKSKNMKTELITNVSHDLKTPLTAIITYIELLKQEGNSQEQQKEYIATLEQKSQRLKILIEDLFEISKAESDNITLNYADVDLVNLLKQVALENEIKIAESGLDIRWNYEVSKSVLSLDPARTYRIMDNLLQNILKYALPNSRVYVDLTDRDDIVTICFKNISAVEMNFKPEEIAERFVRGDLSRNTEGSGLGLAIAQSFTQMQGGKFTISVDGDLFKVTLEWNRNL